MGLDCDFPRGDNDKAGVELGQVAIIATLLAIDVLRSAKRGEFWSSSRFRLMPVVEA